jgi:poly-gamma-glutamate capsule biosynthesis protein CapA/YwtB (metallophosphatase superfamily)
LNLLFPHWGFELELNPRRSMVRKARAWLAKGFNAIVAHHGHTPRALYAEPGRDFGPAALVVDSLGDFVCGFPQEWYSYGMVLKVGLGVDSSGEPPSAGPLGILRDQAFRRYCHDPAAA